MSARVLVRWTPEARARVLSLYGDPSHSGTSIAAVILAEHGLAVSASSVIGIAHRANSGGVPKAKPAPLTYDEARIRNRDRRRRIAAAARDGQPARPPAIARSPKPAAPPKPAPVPRAPRPAPAIVLPSLGIPLTSAPAGVCRFIADDPRAGPALVCGHPVAPGSLWCPGHRAVCVVPTRPVWIPESRRAA